MRFEWRKTRVSLDGTENLKRPGWIAPFPPEPGTGGLTGGTAGFVWPPSFNFNPSPVVGQGRAALAARNPGRSNVSNLGARYFIDY